MAKDKKIRITLQKSVIGCTQKQRAVVQALGLKRPGQVVEHTASPMIQGMVQKVSFLLKVE